MVWVIEGEVNSDREKPVEARGPTSSHYLRPNRKYRLGRMGYSDGTTTIEEKAYDFRIKSKSIGRQGNWEIQTGNWTLENVGEEAVAEENDARYSISILPVKPLTIVRGGIKTLLEASEVKYDLQSGDQIQYTAKQFRVRWESINIVIPNGAKVNQKKDFELKAINAGIKLSFGELASDHTILLFPKFEMNDSTFIAAISAKPISSFAWLNALFRSTQVPNSSAEDLVISNNEKEEEFQKRKDFAKLDKGFDDRYHGHSLLERNWKSLPRPIDLLEVDEDEDFEGFDPKLWSESKLERKNVFRNLLIIELYNFQPDPFYKDLVYRGGGKILSFRKDIPPQDLLAKIQGISPNPHRRLAFLREDGEDISENVELVAKRIEETCAFIERSALIKAVYTASIEFIFSRAPLNRRAIPPTSSNITLVAPTPSGTQPRRRAPDSSFAAAPATHPEDVSQLPGEGVRPSRERKSLEAAAGPIDATPIRPAEVVEAPRRKLTRRVKPVVVEPVLTETSDYSEFSAPQSQGPAPDLDLNSIATSAPINSMQLDNSTRPTTRVPLKRRVGILSQSEPQEPPTEIETRSPIKKPRVFVIQEESSGEERSTPVASTSRRIRDDSAIPDIPSAQQMKRKSTAVENSDEEVPVVKESLPKKKAKLDTALPKPTSKSKAVKESPKSSAKTKGKGAATTKVKKMPPIAISKAAWDGYDSVEELEKLIRADQLDMSETTTGEFKIVMFDISERVKRIPKFTEGLPEKWAGRPNFKAFKPKANKGAGDPIGTKGVGGIVAPRPEITFFESNVPDFGMGDEFKPKKKVTVRSRKDSDDSQSDDSQPKLTFFIKPKPKVPVAPAPKASASSSKAKGKKRQITDSEEEEEDQAMRSATETLAQDDDGDVDMLNDSEDQSTTQKSSGKSSSKPKAKVPAKVPAKKPAAKKVAAPVKAKVKPVAVAKVKKPETIIIDSDSSSDGGVTFKGFTTQRKKI